MRKYYVVSDSEGLPRVCIAKPAANSVLAECESLDEARKFMKKMLEKREKNDGSRFFAR